MKRPTESAKAPGKGQAAPAKVRPCGGASAATTKPSAKREAQRQVAEAECDEHAAAILQREAEQKDSETHRTMKAYGRRAFEKLTFQDAGYSLASKIAGKDALLEIDLEALASWLLEMLVPDKNGAFTQYIDISLFSELTKLIHGSDENKAGGDSSPRSRAIDEEGERPAPLARWQTMPSGSYHHYKRKPHKRLCNGRTKTVIKNASEVLLKGAGKRWLWQELARSADQNPETAKTLHRLLGWHRTTAENFVKRFLSARHSAQLEPRTEMFKAAAAMISGNKVRISATPKEVIDRIIRDNPAQAIKRKKNRQKNHDKN